MDQFCDGLELQGAYVWYEWGDWQWSNLYWRWFWSSHGGTDWCWYPRNGTCFAPGTPLLTPQGTKPIEKFRAGDWILSSAQDDAKAPAVARRVKEVIRSRGKLVDIAVNGQLIHATREHPFYIKGKGWTPAASLAAGDLLRSHDDRWVPVASIVEAAESSVYNVCVEENGTYFVGGRDWGFSVWVYGACNTRETPLEQLVQAKPMKSYFRRGETAFEQVALGIADGGRPGTGLRRLLETGKEDKSKIER